MSERAWTFLRAGWLVVAVAMLSPISWVLLILVPMALMTLAFRLPDVQRRPSMVSVPGAQALWLPSDKTVPGRQPDFMTGEFAHIHPYPDGSMHALLPPARAREMIGAGWAEPHPLAAQMGEDGMVMLYAPRDATEVKVIMTLLADAHAYATGVDTADRSA